MMKIMSLAQMMDKSIDIHRKNLLSITLFQLIFSIITIAIVVGALLIGGVAISLGSIVFLKGSSSVLNIAGIVFVVIVLTVFIVFISSILILNGVGIMEFAKRGLKEQKTLVGGALSFTFKYILKVIGVIVSGFVLFLPIAAVWAGIGWIYYMFFSKGFMLNVIRFNLMRNPTPVIIAAILFLILIIVSSVWFFNIHVFSFHAAVFQKKGFFRALSESRRLVKNNFWTILGYNILFSLSSAAIYYSFNSFVLLIGALIPVILKFFSINQDIMAYLQTVSVVMTWPLTVMEQLFIAPLYSLFITLLYFNQRFKKYGYDLELRLEELKVKMPDEERIMTSGS